MHGHCNGSNYTDCSFGTTCILSLSLKILLIMVPFITSVCEGGCWPGDTSCLVFFLFVLSEICPQPYHKNAI